MGDRLEPIDADFDAGGRLVVRVWAGSVGEPDGGGAGVGAPAGALAVGRNVLVVGVPLRLPGSLGSVRVGEAPGVGEFVDRSGDGDGDADGEGDGDGNKDADGDGTTGLVAGVADLGGEPTRR